MQEYIKRFCTSYEEARKLKEEIYSSPISVVTKDCLWQRIIYFCVELGKAKWYKERFTEKRRP